MSTQSLLQLLLWNTQIRKYKFTNTLSLHFPYYKILPLLRSSSVWRVEREKLPLIQFKTYQGLAIYHAWLVAKVPPFLLWFNLKRIKFPLSRESLQIPTGQTFISSKISHVAAVNRILVWGINQKINLQVLLITNFAFFDNDFTLGICSYIPVLHLS